MTDHPHTHNHQLVGADADAIDALIDAHFDVSKVAPQMRARAMHAASLLGLMDGPLPAISTTLTDVTMARLARIANPMADSDYSLSPDDAEALDAFVASEFRLNKMPSSLRPRAEKLEAMAQLIAGTGDALANPLLVERTMRAVATTRREPHEQPLRATGGFRFADLVSVAAVLLMGVAVMWPVMSTMRSYAQKSDCASNFAGIASAMGQYTSDNRDQFPMATASFGGSWLDGIGTKPDRSNSANLFTLARTKYVPLKTLACEGNPMAVRESAPGAMDWETLPQVSYSYYIMFGDSKPTATSNPNTIIMADRSPVVLRSANEDAIPFPEENSPNHRGEGQWALRIDGSAQWLTSPQVGPDNIWLNGEQERVWNLIRPHIPEIRRMLPKDAKQFIIRVEGLPEGTVGALLRGTEMPSSETDTFLGP